MKRLLLLSILFSIFHLSNAQISQYFKTADLYSSNSLIMVSEKWSTDQGEFQSEMNKQMGVHSSGNYRITHKNTLFRFGLECQTSTIEKMYIINDSSIIRIRSKSSHDTNIVEEYTVLLKAKDQDITDTSIYGHKRIGIKTKYANYTDVILITETFPNKDRVMNYYSRHIGLVSSKYFVNDVISPDVKRSFDLVDTFSVYSFHQKKLREKERYVNGIKSKHYDLNIYDKELHNITLERLKVNVVKNRTNLFSAEELADVDPVFSYKIKSNGIFSIQLKKGWNITPNGDSNILIRNEKYNVKIDSISNGTISPNQLLRLLPTMTNTTFDNISVKPLFKLDSFHIDIHHGKCDLKVVGNSVRIKSGNPTKESKERIVNTMSKKSDGKYEVFYDIGTIGGQKFEYFMVKKIDTVGGAIARGIGNAILITSLVGILAVAATMGGEEEE